VGQAAGGVAVKEIRHGEWSKRLGVPENARRELPAIVSSYFAYVRRELAKDPQPPALHPLRLATKQVRYTLEIFRPFYGWGLEKRLGALRKVQQQLGDVNDCVASWQLLSRKLRRSPERAHMEKFLHQRAQKQAADFRKLWHKLFEAPGREDWWTRYLSRPARR
jgi:CHAD domain-containing protein